MKIRNGFVSNSSSSSFVIFVKKDVSDAIKEECTTFQKMVMEYVESGPMTFCGVELMKYSYFTGNVSTFEFLAEEVDLSKIPDDEDMDSVYDVWDSIEQKLKERSGDDKLTHTEDF